MAGPASGGADNQALNNGDTVLGADGKVYQYTGLSGQSFDLSTENFDSSGSFAATDSSSDSATSDETSINTPTNDAAGGLIDGYADLVLDSYQYTDESGTQDLNYRCPATAASSPRRCLPTRSPPAIFLPAQASVPVRRSPSSSPRRSSTTASA